MNQDLTKQTLLHKYLVIKRFKITDHYAFYKCEYKNSYYLAKAHQNLSFYEEKLDFYQNFQLPGFVKLVDYGFEYDQFIEIFPFYRHDDLFNSSKDTGLSDEYLITELIPTINSALYALHQQKLVHGSVFPYKMFYNKLEKSIVLSLPLLEFPVERMNEYLPKEISEETIFPASDYYSFGLCILYFLIGYNEFYQIVRNENLIDNYILPSHLPSKINPNFFELVIGLTKKNPEKRWNYQEVNDWLEKSQNTESTELLPSKPDKMAEILFSSEEKTGDNHAPIFDGYYINLFLEQFSNLEALRDGILEHWDNIKDYLQVVCHYIVRLDSSLEDSLRPIPAFENKDYAMYKLMELLKVDDSFYWKGKTYSNLKEFGIELSEKLPIVEDSYMQFITSGCFNEQFERTNPKEKKRKKAMKIMNTATRDKALTLYKLAYLLTEERSFTFELGKADTIPQFISLLHKNKKKINQISPVLLANKQFIAWLGHKGYDTFIDHWEKNINS